MFSVIVLSYNKLACTKRCLSALVTKTETEGPWELIAVDNGSADGSGGWCENELPTLGKAHGISVKAIRFPCNIGCSKARNAGIAAAAGDTLVFVDNDVSPCTPRWLPLLKARLDATTRCGMVGPKMIYPPPSQLIQCAGVGISKRGHVCFLGRGEPKGAPEYNEVKSVQCLISACLMVPARLVKEHGGFDEAFHPVQFEDFDLVYRLREKGYEAVYEPAVEMFHDESVTTQGSPNLSNAANVVRNGLLFQRRWRHMFENENGPEESQCRWKKDLQTETQTKGKA